LPTWLTAILVAGATSLVASWAYFWRARADLENQIRIRTDEARRAFYREFVTLLMTFLNQQRGKETPDTEGLMAELMKLQPSIIMYASDEFLRAWNCFRTFAAVQGNRNETGRGLALMGLILQAVRKDLGYPQGEQDPVEILGVLINDLVGNLELEAQVRQAARQYRREIRSRRRRWLYGSR
jgi:hypothetical protein